MSEKIGFYENERDLDRDKTRESLSPRPSETAEDLRKKEIFSGGLKPMEERLKGQLQAIEPVVKDLEQKSQSYLDTLKADNYVLLLTEGTTVTYEDLQSFREYAIVLNTRANTVRRIAFMLASGERWEDITKRGEMRQFMTSPEGKLMDRLASFDADSNDAATLFYFEKAQELSQTAQLGRNGKLLAEGYCTSLKGTQYENTAGTFCPSKTEKFADGSRELARELLSLDQLFIMAASGLVGRGIAAGISGSEKAVRISTRVVDAVNSSKIAKFTLPGAEVFATKAADGKISKTLKIAGNIAIDIGKFAGYETLAKQTGNENIAKAVAIALVFMPGAKAGFESELRKNPMAEAESALAFADWVITNKGEGNARETMYRELVERYKAEKGVTPLPREVTEDLKLMADDAVRLLKTAREGGKINQASRTVETNYGKIAKDNKSTADIYAKLHDGEGVRMKTYEHPVTHEKFGSVTPETYLPAYREGLSKLAKHMDGIKDWTLMSSNTLFLTVGKFKTAPGDLDVIVRAENFEAIYAKFKALAAKGEIGGLQLLPIDKTSVKHVTEENMREVLASGNLKLGFYYKTGQKIPENGHPLLVDTELFFDAKGKGLIQLGEIPRALETFSIDGHKIKTLSPYDSVETYTFNLLDETRRNTVEIGGKAKDATRINNLLSYLSSAGIRKPEDLIGKIDSTVAKYRKYAGPDLSKNFEKVFEGKDEFKTDLKEMIRQFNAQIKINSKRKDAPPGFSTEEFEQNMELIAKQKDKLKQYYQKAINGSMSPEERNEASGLIRTLGADIQRGFTRLQKPEDFAYMYEYLIIETRFIARMNKLGIQ